MNKTGTRVIETERLILRPLTVDDAEDMYRNWASDPEVTKYLTWPPHPDAELTRALLKDWVSRYEAGDFFNWAIVWKETGEVIGNISVVSLTEQIGAAEIGYCMGRRFWGQGIMPEALLAVEDYLFETVGLLRICAGHDVNNPKSGRVMDKAGMTREGVLRQSGKNNQGIVDVEIHSILRGEWEERRKGGSRESR